MSSGEQPYTRISHHDSDHIFVRGHDLVNDLIGKVTFTEMMYLDITGRRPTRAQTVLLDAVLVTLMEHGITPSVLATRVIYDSATEAIQAAVAAGLLGVGSRFIGTMEGASALIEEMLAAPEGVAARARAIAERHRAGRRAVPGFGHPLHRPDDPRTPRLFALAAAEGVKGDHVAALRALSTEVDAVYGRHLTINATGAVAALLGEIAMPREIMRGIAVVSRSAGLVAHIREEQLVPSARRLWDMGLAAIPYREDGEEPA
ncbi:MAG: citryl-CoA lyase [Alphaproteobacteria bacterium]|nr:citryl-CoA lyase [Alphaproteobacteria bacterium]